VHLYDSFSLRRQMAPQQSVQFITVFLVNLQHLREDSIANYVSIWTQLSTSVRGIDVSTKRFVAVSIGGATRFANVRRKFSKT